MRRLVKFVVIANIVAALTVWLLNYFFDLFSVNHPTDYLFYICIIYGVLPAWRGMVEKRVENMTLIELGAELNPWYQGMTLNQISINSTEKIIILDS